MTRRRRDAEHYEFIWQHPVTGTSVRIRIAHTRDYLIAGTDHSEVETHPTKTTIPITETCYVSYFIDPRQLRDARGPQKFIEAWMAREGRSPRWQARDLANRQGDLFAWAATQVQVAKRGVKVASKRRREVADSSAQVVKAREAVAEVSRHGCHGGADVSA